MKIQNRGRLVVRIRRGVQTLFFFLFLWLVLAARGQTGQEPSPLLTLFFDLDPLVQIATFLATHTVQPLSPLAVLSVVLTILLGRVFCGWLCPFGTLDTGVAAVRGRLRRVRPRPEACSSWQRAKYYLLVVLVVMALCGVHWIGVFDPFSLLYRSFVTAFLPGLDYVAEIWTDTVYDADPHLGSVHLTSVTEPSYRFLRDQVFGPSRQVFQGGALILAIFLAAVAANLYRPRFWCRYVCPLGALLGLCEPRPLLRLRNDEQLCKECGKCTKACPAAAQPEKPNPQHNLLQAQPGQR